MNSTNNYLQALQTLKTLIDDSDAIIIGAGAGMSTSAGHTYSGKRFDDNFKDYIEKYHFPDMYTAGFYPFETLEEYFAYWSRHVYINRYKEPPSKPYTSLLELIKDKNYFIITTNVDHCFIDAGFDKKRLFYTQGDYGLFQCSKACHKKTYDNKEQIIQMINKQKDLKIPSELIPYCPVCKAPMTMNLRVDELFVEDKGYHEANHRYQAFIKENKDKKVLLLELGVGYNTPSIIKYPFWELTLLNKNIKFATINTDQIDVPKIIQNQCICIKEDIKKVIDDLNAIH